MKCIDCNDDDTRVIDSRITANGQRRRRVCLKCGTRFSTLEVLADVDSACKCGLRDKVRDALADLCGVLAATK